MKHKGVRLALVVLEAFVALTSIACGLGLAVGVIQFPLACVLATWDMRPPLRQEIVEEKYIAISSLGRWQRKRTDTAIFDAPFSNGYPK